MSDSQTPRSRPVPLGTPLPGDEDSIAAASAITPEDVERAKLAWRRDTAGTGYEGLLDAEPEPEGPNG